MMKFTSKNDTPLLFHKFLWFVALPLGAFGHILVGINEIRDVPYLEAYYLLLVVLMAVSSMLNIVIFIGFFNWSPYAWYCIMTRCAVGIADCLVILVLSLLHLNFESMLLIVERVGSILLTCFVVYYYWSRKPLFFHREQADEPSYGDEN
jgi:hypothetical protein